MTDVTRLPAFPDFNQAPFIVIWEVTRACALRCVHCRADAMPARDSGELSTEDGFLLIEEIRRFGNPVLVLTGGDPMLRPDLPGFVGYANALGLRVALTPSATDEVTFEKIYELREKGLDRLAVSLDGSSAPVHDSFRGVEGSFWKTLDIIGDARELGIPVQINTTVSARNAFDLPAIYRLVSELEACLWSVFFLVPVGRGAREEALNAEETEALFHSLYKWSREAAFDIKTTEAPHYRRFAAQMRKASGAAVGRAYDTGGISRSALGVNDGNGFVFISHTGEIYPSGFLPLSAGNVKTASLVSVYRESPLFKNLRDKSLLKGKCGICEFKKICGGSRARAYAVHGDYLAPDPFCAYVPEPVYSRHKQEERIS